jgi:hypothetical protein
MASKTTPPPDKLGMATSQGRETNWEGGTLTELLSFLAESSLSARIEAFDTSGRLGHIDVIAGGVADAAAGDKKGDDVVTALGKRIGAHFRVELRLPHPTDATLDPPGDREGPLAKRPVAALMRYCEEFVLSCALILEQKGEVARIVYRRGEITATLVDGADAPHRLPDVMGWSEGTFRIDVVAPEMPRRSPTAAKKAGAEVSTLFGYPVPGAKAPPLGPAPAITVAGPRIGERPTPRVPLSVVNPDPVSTRPTPRAAPAAVLTSASNPAPAPIQLTAVASPGKNRAAADASIPGAIPAQLSHTNRPHSGPLRLPETGFLAQPVIVHVFVGVALGLLAVAGYWAYLRAGGTPIPLS